MSMSPRTALKATGLLLLGTAISGNWAMALPLASVFCAQLARYNNGTWTMGDGPNIAKMNLSYAKVLPGIDSVPFNFAESNTTSTTCYYAIGGGGPADVEFESDSVKAVEGQGAWHRIGSGLFCLATKMPPVGPQDCPMVESSSISRLVP